MHSPGGQVIDDYYHSTNTKLYVTIVISTFLIKVMVFHLIFKHACWQSRFLETLFNIHTQILFIDIFRIV